MKTGIAWFSDQHAWYCTVDQPVSLVQSLQDLTPDTLWLTNLTHSELSKAGLEQAPHIRSNDFLQTSLSELSSELGLDALSQEKRLPSLAHIVDRLLNHAQSHWKVAVQETKLTADVARTLQLPPCALPNNFYSSFRSTISHTARVSASPIKASAQTSSFIVRPNRLGYAQYILSHALPSDTQWEHEYKVRTDRSDNWLESVHTPFLIRCTLHPHHAHLQDFLFSNPLGQGRRHWLTDVEWRIIRQHGKVTVDAALICQQPAIPVEYKNQLVTTPYDALSISKGLFAEHLWVAHTLKQPYQLQEWRWSATAIWIRAIDRMKMFEYARLLKEQGIQAAHYGLGSLLITYPNQLRAHTAETVIKAGLLPPIRSYHLTQPQPQVFQ